MSKTSPPASTKSTLAWGKIEITALATLFGSSTAEALILGNKGAPGIVWAFMSIFGMYAAIKACVIAATPNWLRDAFGVRNADIDKIIGSTLELSKRNIRSQLKSGSVTAIQSEIRKDRAGRSESDHVILSQREIHVFDNLTWKCIDALKDSKGIYIYTEDPYFKDRLNRSARNHFYGMLLSTLRVVDVCVFYKLRAYWLAYIAGGSWAICFICALVLIALGLSRKYRIGQAWGLETDILVGDLPTPLTTGGERRILLGLPTDTRYSIVWKITWGLCSLVGIASLVLYYMVLKNLDTVIFYIWMSFQLLWLIFRIIFLHLLSDKDDELSVHLLKKADWSELNTSSRARIRTLAYALSVHLMGIHPRKWYSYVEDAKEIPELDTVVNEYPITEILNGEVMINIDISCVVGDTLLAGVCWAGGTAPHLTGSALYDSCIVQCRMAKETISIPAARVHSKPPPRVTANEEVADGRSFPPRGGSNQDKSDLTWFYWIPCGPERWLQMQSKDLRILGPRSARLVTDEQVTSTLLSDDVCTSLRGVNEIKEIVQTSRKACCAMKDFISETSRPSIRP